MKITRFILWGAMGFGIGGAILAVIWGAVESIIDGPAGHILGYSIGVAMMGAIGGASLGKASMRRSKALALYGTIVFIIGDLLGALGEYFIIAVMKGISWIGFAGVIRITIMGLLGGEMLGIVLMGGKKTKL